MEKPVSNSLYEQLLYTAVTQITNNRKLTAEQKSEKSKNLGELFGKKALIIFSKQLAHNAYNSTDAILNLVATDFWRFLFDNETTNVTSPAPKAISFKDNNLHLLRRLDCQFELREKRDELLANVQHFLGGIIGAVLSCYKIDYKTLVTFQNESLFINITCE